MLNREEYNAVFKTTLSQEEFDEIMGKPVTDLSEVEELVLADKNGNVWRFLPKDKAIPIEFIEELIGQYNDWNEDVEPLIKLIEKWRENNEITG